MIEGAAAAGILGALHGVNPAMGWLLAAGMGLQEESRGAVWRALGPMAAGHFLAIAAVVGSAAALDLVVPAAAARWTVGGLLVGLGVLHLRGHRHAARGGMRVRGRELAWWSFLVATAHGAGLMLLPFLPGGGHHGAHPGHLVASGAVGGMALTAVHTGTYLVVAGLVAALVYERLGLALLRSAWVNLDLLWGAALLVTGVLTPFV